MITYSRFVADGAPGEALAVTEAHVRAHLSAVADPEDDPVIWATDVRIERCNQDGGVLVVGRLDREPHAPYLAEGYDPDAGDTGHTFQPWVRPG